MLETGDAMLYKSLIRAGLAMLLVMTGSSVVRAADAPGEILMATRQGISVIRAMDAGSSVGDVIDTHPRLGVVRLRVHKGLSIEQALVRLRARADVLYAEPNHIRKVCATPNDPGYPNQYSLPLIQANTAWNIWKPRANVVVSVVDTGVQYTHPDLQDVLLKDNTNTVIGYNAQTGTSNAQDDYGHGTHVAGTIAAHINNGVGVAGVAGWNPGVLGSDTFVKIMPVKVLDNTGSGTDSDVAGGITWATDHGAQIISMSLGGPDFSTTLQNACAYAWSHGVVVVAAAGNSAVNTLFYPAAYPNVISVAATDGSDTLASFSNYGSWVDVAAPGVNIYSTYPTSTYAWLSGTSMATPHVSGEAALMRSQNPTLTNAQVSQLITTKVDPYNPYSGRSIATGAGRINVYKALVAAGDGLVIPAAPTGVTATAASNSSIVLTWSDTANAITYNIYRSTTVGGEGTTPYKTGITAITYTDLGLTSGLTYYYKVSAVSNDGESPLSAEVKATTTTQTEIRINCGGPAYTDTLGNVWQADTYFTGGGSYNGGNIAISNTTDPTLYRTVHWSATTFSYLLPAANGSYNLNLRFAEIGYNGAGYRNFNVSVNGAQVLSNYDIFVAAGGFARAVTQSIPITVTNGQVSIVFQAVKDTAMVNAIELVSLAPSVPSIPIGLAAAPGNGLVTLTWVAASGASTYNVYRSTTPAGEGSTPYATGITTASYIDNVVTNGTAYYYTLTGVNTIGESAQSLEVKSTPNVPLTQAAIRINAGGPAYTDTLGNVWLDDTLFTGGASYNGGNMAISNTVDPTLYRTVHWSASTFSYLLPVANGSYNLNLRFAEIGYNGAGYRNFNVSVNGAQVLSNYDIFVAAGGFARAVTQSIPITVTNGQVSIVFQAVKDTVMVNAIELVSTAPTAPNVPTGLVAFPGNGLVALTWAAASGASTYKVYRSTTPGGEGSTPYAAGINTTSYSDNAVTNGTTYYYTVSAVNNIGESEQSLEVKATPNAPSTQAAIRINAGGPAYTDTLGNIWQADTFFTGGASYNGGNMAINNTVDPTLYRTVHWSATTFSYLLLVANGSYNLNLRFAEIGYNGAGYRKFNVSVDGAQVLSNYDIFVAAGGFARAVTQSIPVTVINGQVSILFQAVKDTVMVNAIELIPN